jgi:hypothetical protein
MHGFSKYPHCDPSLALNFGPGDFKWKLALVTFWLNSMALVPFWLNRMVLMPFYLE